MLDTLWRKIEGQSREKIGTRCLALSVSCSSPYYLAGLHLCKSQHCIPIKWLVFNHPPHVSHVISHVTGCIAYHWFYVQNLFNSNPIPVMPPSYTHKIVAFILDASSDIIYIYIFIGLFFHSFLARPFTDYKVDSIQSHPQKLKHQ